MNRIGFDIGGTFTDFALDRPGRGPVFHKVSSTPADPAIAVASGLSELLRMAGEDPATIADVLHATTVATNAILERKGARTALVTTAGFRDVLLLGRQKRYDVFDLYLSKPCPLVRRRDIFEVEEHVGADGAVVEELDLTSLDRVVSAIGEGGYASVAVCFLHAFANAAHEIKVVERLRERLPGVAITASSDVSPRYREYERASTTVANAYVQPAVTRYVEQLERVLAARSIGAGVSIMQSNGGLVSTELACRFPVRIVESGPAAGVLMCAEVGRELGLSQLLTFDMGGTTAKLGVIEEGRPSISPTFEVDMVRFLKGSGLPLNIPSVELLEIGAGGGSIASLEMGMIKVGPHSAGSDPGPMCYGRGGRHPTVTDANVVLGYIDPANFNGGAIRLDAEASLAGIREGLAAPLGMSVGRAAWGVHAMVSSNMERALRIVSIERGRDPRHYAMVAFGGAGPIHATRLARQVGIRRVVVPFGAGVGSAIGLLRANPKVDASITKVIPIEAANEADIRQTFTRLRARVLGELTTMRMEQDALAWRYAAYVRYRGQGHEVRVDVDSDPDDSAFVSQLETRFREAYARNFGYVEDGVPCEATEWYASAERQLHRDRGAPVWVGTTSKPRGRRQAYLPEADDYRDVLVVDRASIGLDHVVVGPAIIEEREATTVLLGGDVARVSAHGHLVIDIGGGAS